MFLIWYSKREELIDSTLPDLLKINCDSRIDPDRLSTTTIRALSCKWIDKLLH